MSDDISREEMNNYIAGMKGLTGALGKLQATVEKQNGNKRNPSGNESSEKKGIRQRYNDHRNRNLGFNSKLLNAENALSRFGTSLDRAGESLQSALGGILGGAIVGMVLKTGQAMARQYSELTEVGQSFGGSLMSMHEAAAAAGLPLSDFAELVKKNSAVVASMNHKNEASFVSLALAVRKSAEQQGMYGYSVEQLNAIVGENMETSRLYGMLDGKSRKLSAEELTDLAEVTNSMAAVTGKARSEISSLAQEAMRGTFALAGMLNTDKAQRAALQKNLAVGATVFASQQGEAGRFLSTFFSDTVGVGNSVFTDAGKTLIQGGLGQLSSAMDQLANKTKAGTASEDDYYNYINNFVDEVERNGATLKGLALSGNEQAKQIITNAAQMKRLDAGERRRIAEQAKEKTALTKMFSSFESVWGRLRGEFLSKFLPAIKPLFDNINKALDEGGGLEPLVKAAGDLGKWFGGLVSSFATKENSESLVGAVKTMGTAALTIGKALAWIADLLGGPTFTVLGWAMRGFTATINGVAEGAKNFIQYLTGASDHVADVFGTLIGAAAGLAAWFGSKKLIGMIKTFFGGMKVPMLNVKGGVVKVYGADGSPMGGSGGPDLPDGPDGEGKKKGRKIGSEEHEERRRKRMGRVRRGRRIQGITEGFSNAFKSRSVIGAVSGLFISALGAAAADGVIKSLFGGDDDDDDDKSEDRGSHAVPMTHRLLTSSMISNQKDREQFFNLMAKQEELRKGEQTDETRKQTEQVTAGLDKLRDQYGKSYFDMRESNLALASAITGNGLPTRGKEAEKLVGPDGKPFAPINPAKKDQGKKEDDHPWLDKAQLGLSVAGMFPILGAIPDVLNAGISGARGNWGEAGLNMLAAIPEIGDMFAAGRLGAKASKSLNFGLGAASFGGREYLSMSSPTDPNKKNDDLVRENRAAMEARDAAQAHAENQKGWNEGLLDKIAKDQEGSSAAIIALQQRNNVLLQEQNRLLYRNANSK